MNDISQAVLAWRRLRPDSPEPRNITVLKDTKRTLVCKLDGIGMNGSAVVAKRCKSTVGHRELLVYDQILRRLPLDTVRCYGYLEESGEAYGWLFLEDGGARWHQKLSESFPPLIAHWLGLFHAAASSVACQFQLPDRGPNHYLDMLRYSRQVLLEHRDQLLQEPVYEFSPDTLLTCLGIVEANWKQIELGCNSLPWTLVHGDFQAKNILTRTSAVGAVVFPIDWTDSGWGPPAADLRGIECRSYWLALKGQWPGVKFRSVEEQTRSGSILKLLAYIRWATGQLAVGSVNKAAGRLQAYEPLMSSTVRTLRLLA